MNIRSLLARRVGGLKPSSIRALNPLMRLPGMISLGGGYPNAQTFAISSLEVVFKSGRRFTIRERAMGLACQNCGVYRRNRDAVLAAARKSRLIVFHCGFVKCISVEFALDLLYEEGMPNRVLPGAPR